MTKEKRYNYCEERENFMHLSPRMTGLNNEVRVDVNHSFEMFRHPLIAYIPNTYSKWGKEFIVVTVEEHPKIVQFVDDLKLMIRDLNKTILWLKENRQLLRNVADGTIYNMDFVALLRTNRDQDNDISSEENRFGISVDIWSKLEHDELDKIFLFDADIIEDTDFMTKTYNKQEQKVFVVTKQQEDKILTKEKYSYIFPNYREDERGKYVVAIDFFDKHNNIYLEDL